MTLLIAIAAGALIGLSLGALGGGGSILAVPVLVYLLGQDAGQATTGSLVVVGVTSLIAAVTAHVADPVLLAAFAALMLLVSGLMAYRQLRHRRDSSPAGPGDPDRPDPRRPSLDDPIIAFREGFMCDCPRAVKILITATAVGLLTGFFGVGGGFLVVPALALALALPMDYAAGTSLVVITLTSAAALAVRAGVGSTPDWALVGALTAASAVGGIAGARLADRLDTTKLSAAFTVLVLGVAVYTATQALPALT